MLCHTTFGSKVVNKRFGPYSGVECTSASPSREAWRSASVSSRMHTCRGVKQVWAQTYRPTCIENIDDVKKKNPRVFLFLCEAYIALLQVLNARQLKVAPSRFLRSEATIPTVPSSLVSRALCYLFRGQCRVPLGACSVESCSSCLIRWAGPEKKCSGLGNHPIKTKGENQIYRSAYVMCRLEFLQLRNMVV